MSQFSIKLNPNSDTELLLEYPNSQDYHWHIDHETLLDDPTWIDDFNFVRRKKDKKKRKQTTNASQQCVDEKNMPLESGVERLALDSESYVEVVVDKKLGRNSGPSIFLKDDETQHSMLSGNFNHVRTQVSSRHICAASPMFHKMLHEQRKGKSSNDKGSIRLRISKWDVEALLVVLDIIHGRHSFVPEVVSLELLAKIAAIVDYYECHEVVNIFVDHWIQNMEESLILSYGKTCVLWMSISWVFLRADIFEKMMKIALTGCRGPIQTMGLPLPDTLLRKIEIARQGGIQNAVCTLEHLRQSLCEDRDCQVICTYILLGSLTKQIYDSGISVEHMEIPFHGYRLGWLQKQISAFTSPPANHPYLSCSCTLEEMIRSNLGQNVEIVETLTIDDNWRRRVEERDSKQIEESKKRNIWLAGIRRAVSNSSEE